MSLIRQFPRLLLLTASLTLSCLLLSSCQTLEPTPIYIPPPVKKTSTIRHTVAPGETIWRISKIYNVPISAIVSANGLRNETDLKMGQHLVIPHASSPHQIISMFPSNKWRYIIIHHSATGEGSSLSFHQSHLAKGWNRGIGYHFVVNNGHGEKSDGFIEITPRWLKQQDGAHCKASDMNEKGIGISLVGNFNQDKVTKAQMNSLVNLVDQLRKHYKIPAKNILGHGHVNGAITDCPGTHFPWAEFKQRLKTVR